MTAPSLRDRLRRTEGHVLATFVTLPRVEVVELVAVAGFDAVILDLEHGPFGVGALPPLVAAAHGQGLAAIVRVPDGRAQVIGAALDVGADAILVPHVTSAAGAGDAARAARFPPQGTRGANPWVRAAQYGADARYLEDANERVAVIAMVEGREGLENLDAILDVEGVDAVFVGPVDLSSSLGLRGDTEHPSVVQLAADVIRRAAAAGVAPGIFAPTPSAAARWVQADARFVALGVDAGLMLAGLSAATSELNTALGGAAHTAT